jgi:hypothetical protein
MSNSLPPQDPTAVLWKGCLGGIGLTALFFVISGSAYFILSSMDVPRNLLLFGSIGSGPICGTFVLIGVAVWIASRQKPGPRPTRPQYDDDDA